MNEAIQKLDNAIGFVLDALDDATEEQLRQVLDRIATLDDEVVDKMLGGKRAQRQDGATGIFTFGAVLRNSRPGR